LPRVQRAKKNKSGEGRRRKRAAGSDMQKKGPMNAFFKGKQTVKKGVAGNRKKIQSPAQNKTKEDVTKSRGKEESGLRNPQKKVRGGIRRQTKTSQRLRGVRGDSRERP